MKVEFSVDFPIGRYAENTKNWLDQNKYIIGGMTAAWLPVSLYANNAPITISTTIGSTLLIAAESTLIWSAISGLRALVTSGYDSVSYGVEHAPEIRNAAANYLETHASQAISALRSAGNYFGSLFRRASAQQNDPNQEQQNPPAASEQNTPSPAGRRKRR